MFIKVLAALHERSQEDRGAVAAEYAVLLALVAVALVVAIEALTGGIVRAFDAAVAVLP